MAKALDPIAVTLILFAAFSIATPSSDAQMAASRDLTQGWSVPPEHVPSPASDSCPHVKQSISDSGASSAGEPSHPEGEHMELSIVEISPPQLTIGEEFIATVRLKNAGSKEVMVPATADGQRLTGKSDDVEEKNEEKYEVGDISFRLATGKNHRIPIFLSSVGALFADPDDKNTYVPLSPGTWLDVRLKGTVECGAAKCLGGLQADTDGELTAWWYQRVLTHAVKGCNEDHGAIKVREVDSVPFRVVVHNSVKKTENSPHI